ncbi:MAG: V-type ATP synthase subunit D [Thermodesulfobacteriota bacterium]|nr:V-type ATP synthase subunit D [Thermodesulfobacteriota bacterium]
MADILQNVKPTRMELLKLKKRMKLAERGYKLLKEKRDALVSEFMIVIKKYKDAKSDVEEKLKDAFYNLSISEVLMGSQELDQISRITLRDINFDVKTKNIMGVYVPIMKTDNVIRRMSERGYGFLSTNGKIDDTAKGFEDTLVAIVRLAEVEESVRGIAEEVEKTKRRVNALEYIVVPRLRATIKHIEMRMEEIERESFLRLKKIKASLQARKQH